MKALVSRYGLLAGLLGVFLIVFGFGGVYSRYMTAQIDERANEGANAELLALFPGATDVTAFTPTAVARTYALADGRGDFTPTLVASYKVYADDVEIGVIYTVRSYGKFENLVVTYAFDLATDAVVSIKVVEQHETPAYYGTLGTAFFAQFDGKALEDIGLAVDAVAGATYSSKGFEIALLYAREQYAADFGFVIPSVVMTLNALTYNFDPDTFVARPFIADVTYGDDDVNVVVYLDATFNYAGLVAGVEPEADVKAAIRSIASADGSVSANVGFVEYDAEARILVVFSKGFNAEALRVEFTLNATLDSIESYQVDSHETYSEEYNELYNHNLGEVPYVEEYMIDQYLADEIVIDGVAGASVTTAAMHKLIALVDQFVDAIGGGE